jgi:hypothetical protein
MKCRAGRRPFVDTHEEHNQQHFAVRGSWIGGVAEPTGAATAL